MATVLRARHVQTGQIAAIKTVPAARPNHIGFIRREIHALAQLRHPGVVRILEHGIDRGIPWYAMEYVEGRTLRAHRDAVLGPPAPDAVNAGETTLVGPRTADLTRAGLAAVAPAGPVEPPPLPPTVLTPAPIDAIAALLGVTCRLCDALSYLHGEGLVHRDLKPDNVMVRRDGSPVLVDFGISSRFPGDQSREVLDLDHPTAGTVRYMAPEQIAGERPDARTDLYALGCLLYQLVTGRPPFEGDGYDNVARQHLLATPPAPSSLVANLPPGLDELVSRLLAKRPQDRLGYASDVARALLALGATPPATAPAPAPRTYLYLPRFAGRERELEALREYHGNGRSGLVVVSGVSGIGKTRLVLEFAREARRRGAIVLGGTTDGRTPLSGLGGALRQLADRCRQSHDPSLPVRIGTRAKVLAAYDAAWADLPGVDELPEPAELPLESARNRLYSYLVETISIVAETRSVCLLVDDLQAVDELTSGFLEFLATAGRLDRHRVFVVATYRVEESSGAITRLHEHPSVRHIALQRVADDAVGTIVGDMLGRGVAPPAFAEFLSARSEGNPFFVAEYMRTAVAESLLYRDDSGRWQVGGAGLGAAHRDYAELPLPRSLSDLVARRLAQLSDAGRELTGIAAVIGRTTSVDLLAQVAELDDDNLFTALEELLARHVLEEEASGQLRFVHDLIRAAAYARLGAGARRDIHRAAALACERMRSPADDELAATLGHHWERAGDVVRARHFHLRAARHAASRHAYAAAADAYDAYLALVAEVSAESITARIELGRDTLIVTGEHARARAALDAALADARASGDRSLEAAALAGSAKVYWRTGELVDAVRDAEAARALFGELGDAEGVASANERLAAVAWKQGRLDDALEICRGVLATRRQLAKLGPLAMTLGNLGAILVTADRPDEAVVVLDEALRLHRQTKTVTVSLGGVINNLALCAVSRGDIDEAYSLFAEARTVLGTIGDRFNEPAPVIELAVLLRRARGDHDAALRNVGEAETLTESFGDRVVHIQCVCERGHNALARGAPAVQHLERAQQMLAEIGVGPASEAGVVVARLARAQLAFARGEPLFRGECPADLPDGLRRWLELTKASPAS